MPVLRPPEGRKPNRGLWDDWALSVVCYGGAAVCWLMATARLDGGEESAARVQRLARWGRFGALGMAAGALLQLMGMTGFSGAG